MTGQLVDKVALITGASNGIGQAVAMRFLEEGAQVVAFSRSPSVIDNPRLLAVAGERYVSVVGDVRSAADNERAVQAALERFGRLDVLVANAGIYDNRRALRTMSPDELDGAFAELFDINVKGYLLAARAAVDALERSRGTIIFTSSLSGTTAGFGGALYVAAKHAINGLTKQLALELAPHIRVNAIAPGYVPTALKGVEHLSQGPSTSAPTASQQLLQVIPTAQDFAPAYVFLASDATKHCATGTILPLDGGSALRGPRS